jgi:hypothetical protein
LAVSQGFSDSICRFRRDSSIELYPRHAALLQPSAEFGIMLTALTATRPPIGVVTAQIHLKLWSRLS